MFYNKKICRLTAVLPVTLLALPAAAADNETLHYNLVNFRESVSVTVANDTLNVSFNISEKAKNRQQAAQVVTRRLNALLARIKANRAFESETTNRQSYPEYDDKQRVNGWRDSVEVQVRSQDFAALMRLIADSEQDAAVTRMYYSVSPQKRAAAVEEATEKVLQTFQQRAQGFSRSLGFSGYKIVRLDLNSSFTNVAEEGVSYARAPLPMAMPVTMQAKSAANAMDNNPGKQQIHQSINASVQMY
ncbi:SIMPL domain-containing protein [Conchiformibius steedae DSM 2580]|uniref:SIMPL domain-containing protein n=1 Tax=Conchiformibius steedae DSM 2580 TaxID=1121352 RepID=A0AAE9HYF3_9NEIS|nr:SIMPL domain-containing protein [Conchiformibius steedae]QMT32857.1 SIMPL domain-containing protein [Conchiformibius steedae]URD67471.1 SIMPL domain-containing protein [Conchiformibius steedae DSM 2580]